MTLSNMDRVGRALEVLARGLGPFVDRHMAAFLSGGRDWLQVMAERARREGGPRKMGRSDPRLLLRVIWENPRAFREPLSKLELAYAREIAEVANRWAHLEPFSDADASRALDTMMRLLRAAAADSEAREVAALLAGRRRPGLPAEDNGMDEDDLTGSAGPAAVAPAVSRETAGGSRPSADAPAGEEVAEFRDRDGDYRAWVAAYGAGYVINIGRSGRGKAALHRAGCGTITNTASSTHSYMKVCSQSVELLDAWALQHNGSTAPRCRICHPPPLIQPTGRDGPRQAAPAVPAGPAVRGAAGGVPRPQVRAQPARPSKYDALRDFLAGNGAGPVTLTLAEIDLLVGTLPRSARLYHLWWRNDDSTHPHCRSWGDAGYEAHPDLAAQEVTFITKPG